MGRITDQQVSVINDEIAQASTTAQAFKIIDGLSRGMLARLLDLNGTDPSHCGLGWAGRAELGKAHGWDHSERDDDRPADGAGPCDLRQFESHSRRPLECRRCARRKIDHRPVRRPVNA